ncbi:MAG: hypothetical protein HGB23_03465 [Chlorobiaceae bacterium]|nr:hypothetical protein [Chlorobiaceae bacterium]
MMNRTQLRRKLKKITCITSLLAACSGSDVFAREGVGVGLIVGEPTGVSMKYWLDKSTAIDAALAVSLSDNNPFQFHADYLVHSKKSITPSELKGRFPWYYGIGGRIKNNHETTVGVRIPVGITYLFADTPIDLFAEIAPVLDVAPTVRLGLNGAAGIRFYLP